jgi:hypothetical protein
VLELDGREVRFSNPDKVFFPERGYTKLDLCNYYLAPSRRAKPSGGKKPSGGTKYSGAKKPSRRKKSSRGKKPSGDRKS